MHKTVSLKSLPQASNLVELALFFLQCSQMENNRKMKNKEWACLTANKKCTTTKFKFQNFEFDYGYPIAF